MTTLEKTAKAYDILKSYEGSNPYLVRLRNDVFAYKTKSLGAMDIAYVLGNHEKEPVEVNKTVMVASWWGDAKQKELGLEFSPRKIKILWLIAETDIAYHISYIVRRSQEQAYIEFVPKKAVVTDFMLPPYDNLEIDFSEYEKRSGRKLYEHQEEAVRFLTARKRAILASDMGSGKSTAAIIAALHGGYEKVLIISPASVKTTWKRELSMYVDEDEITIIEGSKYKEAKFTIVNYDILKNFYTVPTQTFKSKSLILNDEGELEVETKDRTVVSRSNKIIDKAMSDSQLFQSNFDLIIIDEAHRLSNTSSGIFKIVSDMVKRMCPKGIFALTGTPITNRPVNFFNILKVIGASLASDWQYYVERYCDGKSFYNKKERDAQTFLYLKKVKKASWYDLTSDEKSELDKIIDKKCRKTWVVNGSSNLDELQEAVKGYYLRRMKEEFGTLPSKRVKFISYTLTPEERSDYENIWHEYVGKQDSERAEILEKYKTITESIKERQWLSSTMVGRTIDLARKCVDVGRKVVIFCSFDDEIDRLKEAFGDICVIHNGKMNAKKKDESVRRFQEDENVKIFIGNIKSASVGLTLIAGTVAIFNSFSWVSGDNLQAEDRIHRLNQKHDVTIYYQVFKDTFYEDMLDTVRGKQDVISRIIVDEKSKK